jgi:dye decolorizing peroxidase
MRAEMIATMGVSSAGVSRRLLLTAGTAGAAGIIAGSSGTTPTGDGRPAGTGGPAAVVDAHGEHQAGIARPRPAQGHCTLVVCDLPPAGLSDLFGLLAGLGERIHSLTRGDDPALGGLSPAALTVTVGLGPRVVATVDPTLPGTSDLPAFRRERISPGDRGGDLMLQCCATDPLVVSLAATALLDHLGVPPRWRAHGFQGTAIGKTGVTRNLFGFPDGIAVPRTDAEFNEQVWIDGRLAGATIAVVRRITLNTTEFLRQPLARQEAVIGRRREDAEPLSGGGPDADIDLGARTNDGEYLIPVDAHVRLAHPLTNGTGLMLRRSYNTPEGLLFISFQRELRTFTATQSTMDERDALIPFTTVTASGTFLILPGFTAGQPLGTALRPRTVSSPS